MLSAARKNQLLELMQCLNIKLTDEIILDEALTHPSYNFESNREDAPDYERLAFLGDSVLRLAVSNYLFDKYKNYPEGKLTKIRSYLVSDEFLFKIALKLQIKKYLNLGIHEEKNGGREKESILACSMEAILGAIFKNCGFNYVQEFIYKIYNDMSINFEEILSLYNSKEILQQYTQGLGKDLPVYRVIEEKGLEHNKIYVVNVSYRGEELGVGTARTKKEAEKNAALNAVKRLNLICGEENE